MQTFIRRLQSLLVAITVLGLSAGLAFGATPPAAGPGLGNAASHAGKTVPVAGGDETLGEDEDTDEDEDGAEDEETDEDADTDEDVDADEDLESPEEAEGGENCVDPSALLPEELDALNHGAVVCWAAHQTEWPEWFANHGAFVRCWAHQGKADAASCTEDPAVDESTPEEPTADATKGGHGKGHGKAKGKFKHGA
jgi:hypothetical protein